MNINYLLRRALLILAFGSVMFLFSCNEDEDPVEAPIANFTFSVNNDTGEVTFTNTSSGEGNTYSWSFGDNTTSTLESPTKTYTESDDYEVTLTASNEGGSDSETKTVTVELVVVVTDTEAPVITLEGDAAVSVEIGGTYEDAGATANDNVDGDISANIAVTGEVNTLQPGEYTLAYNVSDAAGNAATEVTRTVTVTFDDGLLTNGDFQAETADPWFVNFGEGNVVPITTNEGNKFFEVNISGSNPNAAFQVNLSQVLTIEEGATYKLSFNASTGEGQSRNIIAGIGLNAEPFTNITNTVDLTTATQRFNLELVANAGGENSRVLFDLNGADGVVVLDNISLVKTADAPVPTAALPLDFESDDQTFGVFNGAAFAIVANPDDAADKVGQITNIGAAWEGIELDLGTPVDFTTDKEIAMQFNSSVGVPVLLKFEGAGAPVEVATTSDATGWQELVFDFSTVGATGTFTKIVLFVDGPGATAGTFLIDDITQQAGSGGGGGGGGSGSNGCSGDLVAATMLPLDFEGCETFLSSQNFGDNISSEIVENPFKEGVNTSDFVLKVDKPANASAFAGIQNTFPTDANPLDFTENVLKLKVYSTKANVNFRFELILNPNPNAAGNPAPQVVNIANANEWTEVEVAFSGFPVSASAYNQLVIKPDNDLVDSPLNGDGTYYIDDINVGPASDSGEPSTYCGTQVKHFGGNAGSEALLTIEKVTRGDGFPALKFTIATDPTNGKVPDALILNSFEGGNGLEAVNTSVAGEISQEVFWPSGAPANNETLFNVLWSFEGEEGNWQLFEAPVTRVSLDSSCE